MSAHNKTKHSSLAEEPRLERAVIATVTLESVDRLAVAFERSWSASDPPSDRVARWVSRAAPDLRQPLATELTMVDLELRSRRAAPGKLVNYLRRLPELLSADGWPDDDLVRFADRLPPPPADSAEAVAAPESPIRAAAFRIIRMRRVSLEPAVFDAEHVDGRPVLLTLYPPMTRAATARIRRIVEEMAICTGAPVPPVREYGSADGCLYVVQDPPAGPAIDERTANEPASWKNCARWAAAVARAVAALHSRKIAHGAVTPSAVVITATGVAQLLGLPAPERPPGRHPMLTDPRLPFLSPEESWALQEAIEPAADIFGLGAVLFHLLTGRPPYALPDPRRVMAKALACAWEEEPLISRRVPRSLRAVCRQALRREPEFRHPSAEAFLLHLERGIREAMSRRLLSWFAAAIALAAVILWILRLAVP